jgi:hypothetical protein
MGMYIHFNTGDLPSNTNLKLCGTTYEFGGGVNQDLPWVDYFLEIIIDGRVYNVDFVGSQNGDKVTHEQMFELAAQTCNRDQAAEMSAVFIRKGVPFSYA